MKRLASFNTDRRKGQLTTKKFHTYNGLRRNWNEHLQHLGLPFFYSLYSCPVYTQIWRPYSGRTKASSHVLLLLFGHRRRRLPGVRRRLVFRFLVNGYNTLLFCRNLCPQSNWCILWFLLFFYTLDIVVCTQPPFFGLGYIDGGIFKSSIETRVSSKAYPIPLVGFFCCFSSFFRPVLSFSLGSGHASFSRQTRVGVCGPSFLSFFIQ